MAIDDIANYQKGKPTAKKVTPVKKTVAGSKGWGSARAAEYGIPSLAVAENFSFTPANPTKGDEAFAYNDTSGTGTTGGSGSGGSAGPSALDRYVQQLQRILTGGGYAKPYNDLESQLQSLYGQATPKVNEAMSGLQTFLQGQTNPYAGFQAQQTEVTPQLSELLASQGVSQNPLQQLAATTQAQNAGQATAFNNLVGTLGQLYGANQQSAIQGAKQQQADLLSQLEQSRLGMGSQIAEKKATQQQDLMKMLLTALSKGGKPKKGRLF